MIGIPMVHGVPSLRALYTAADLYISLSYEESQGLSLVEALACGTQVLCYDQTALPEIVTPDTGLAVPIGNLQNRRRRLPCAAGKPKNTGLLPQPRV